MHAPVGRVDDGLGLEVLAGPVALSGDVGCKPADVCVPYRHWNRPKDNEMIEKTSADETPAAAHNAPMDPVASVALHAARIQIAAVTTAGKVVGSWAHSADDYVQAMGDELLRRVEGETASPELVVALATATRSHLRDVSALPSVAAAHFSSQLGLSVAPAAPRRGPASRSAGTTRQSRG